LAIKEIKLNYLSVERFLSDYAQLRNGSILLPAKATLPESTGVALQIFIPVIEKTVTVEGTVTKSDGAQADPARKKRDGLLIRLKNKPAVALKDLNDALSTYEDYRVLLGLPPPDTTSCKRVKTHEKPIEKVIPAGDESSGSASGDESGTNAASPDPPADKVKAPSGIPPPNSDPSPNEPPQSAPPAENDATETRDSDDRENDALSMAWIRDAISQEEAIREEAIATQISPAPDSVKQQLSEEERNRVKPSGDFLMDLTKAMLRSGYYAPDHPGSQGAKEGLYEAFQKCLGDSREIMITSQVTRQSTEILITGILGEPVNVRTLVGSGMAGLFVPKLQEYFDRKNLVSFAIKKDIPPDHFERFVDIMSDPQADKGTQTKIGELLSTALVEHGITQISTVFKDDLIALELNLPWRVEMAIQRLAKDLTILPMFRSKSEDAIRRMKLQIIQDILRPLKHPEFLKDLIINCYIIAQHVKSLEAEDVEKVVIEAFPLNSLLPTSQLIFEELHQLRRMQEGQAKHAILERRLLGIKRILKWFSQRMVQEDVKGVQAFLESLYLNQILTFEELPADVQYFVNTGRMASDVKKHARSYVDRFLQVKSTKDAVILIKLFRRVLPALIGQSEWPVIYSLCRSVDKSAKTTAFFKPSHGLPANPLIFVFSDQAEKIAIAYDSVNDSQRKMLNDISSRLDNLGIDILSKALSDSEKRSARKAAMEALIKRGDMSSDWARKVLDSPGQKWYLTRNALLLLGYVGQDKKDSARSAKFMRHDHPRVRDEALKLVIRFKSDKAEELVINALDDVDDKVRWRAMNGLKELSPISEIAVRKVLDKINADIPEEIDASGNHYRKIAQYIQALGSIPHIPNHAEVEDTILEIAGKLSSHKKGLLKRFKRSGTNDHRIPIAAAVTALGNIGTAKSEPFLEKLAGSRSLHAESAQKAANSIKLREIDKLSDKPDSTSV
jgi:HEAT repeat protein